MYKCFALSIGLACCLTATCLTSFLGCDSHEKIFCRWLSRESRLLLRTRRVFTVVSLHSPAVKMSQAAYHMTGAYSVIVALCGVLQVFEVDKAPTQDGALSVEPVRKGRELSERINALITDLRRGRAVYPQCFVVRQGKSSTGRCCFTHAVSSYCCLCHVLPFNSDNMC